jgi:hypothetical protein
MARIDWLDEFGRRRAWSEFEEKEVSMLVSAIVIFALAALGGIVLAFMHLTKKSAPLGLACLHGALAVTGVILLLVGMSQGHTAKGVVIALVLFVVAALGGLVLITAHLRSRPLPAALIVVHALVAVAGFLTLLTSVVRQAA